MTHLSLPFQLSDGSVLGVYIMALDSKYMVTDDGTTMFNLSCNDIDLTDRRKWVSLRNIADRYGYHISEAGAIRRAYEESELPQVTHDILLLMAEVVNWEAALHETGDLDLSLTMEVEQLLTLMYHRAPEKSKEIKGHHGALYVFDFYVGDTYIDVFKPHPASTGSKLRKVIDLRRSYEDLNVMFVIDDRMEPEKAATEMGIFSGSANSIKLTDLQRKASPYYQFDHSTH